MSGALEGLRVLDLTRGIAGPMTGMMLADQGADVVRISPPGGDGFDHLPGYAVWNRGKRIVTMNLKDPSDRDQFRALAARADVVVESYSPGVTTRLGIDYATLSALNPRLVYASITGYGRDTADAHRPGIEWLVTARAGLQWDQRSYYGTRMEHIMGTDAAESSFEVPPGVEQTGTREGPIFLAVPWASIGAVLVASAGISAALYVREQTGLGQLFETSLVQSAILQNAMGWQRVAAMHPSYRLWYFDRRAPKGIFAAADGEWLHQWAPIEHEFIRANAALAATGSDEVVNVSARPHMGAGTDYEAQVRFQADQHADTAAAIATLPRSEWVRRFAEAGRAAQPILSPEQGLLDETLEREGVIVEVDDPVHGRIRQAGHTYRLDAVEPIRIVGRRSTPESPSEVASAWSASQDRLAGPAGAGPVDMPAAPLEGIVVLDFGIAIAGPFGAQILADLGATVIKITSLEFSLTDAIYVGSSRGKLAIALDLKHPRGFEVAERLIATADVVHHNMRTGVAERLGIGYEQAKTIRPDIIYCHTRGFEQNGPRTSLPGNDQMGNALAGSAYEGGGTHHGTAPIWHTVAMGDTGNGILSVSAVVQALLHRARTGAGQFVHTSILNACMLFNTYTFAFPDGSGPDRQRIDAGQFGFSAQRRLYATQTEWLCIYVRNDAEWSRLCAAIADAAPSTSWLAGDERAASGASRAANDDWLANELTAIFAADKAERWFAVLDAAGVPCEIASSTFARELFDDQAMHDRGWVATNPHEHLGSVDHVAMPFSFSASPKMNTAGAPVTGQHSRQILAGLGYSSDEIEQLIDCGAVGDQQPNSAVR